MLPTQADVHSMCPWIAAAGLVSWQRLFEPLLSKKKVFHIGKFLLILFHSLVLFTDARLLCTNWLTLDVVLIIQSNPC